MQDLAVLTPLQFWSHSSFPAMLLHCAAAYRIFSRSLSFDRYLTSCHRSHFHPLDCFECTDEFSFIMAPADVRLPHATRSPSTEQISATETYFLPDNPPPHLTPSLTHQPELLFMQGLLDSLANVVTQILNHPMIDRYQTTPSSPMLMLSGCTFSTAKVLLS